MTTSARFRLLLDGPARGAWNMAVDEVLLEAAAAGGGACWRFYRWQEPTLSLGYFQAYHERWSHGPSRQCESVRRLTGGGAILHDAELTYSIVLPGRHRLALRRDLLYETVHGCLIAALAGLGVSAGLCRGRSRRDRRPEPFLCFQRRSPGDVLLGEAKIAGSAQRRRRGAVLQHGSLLLGRSAAAPELPGLEDLAGKAVPAQSVADLWLANLARQLAVEWLPESLSDGERKDVALLAETLYASPAWTENRDRGQPRVKERF